MIYLHPHELARITARAQARGQTPARFIRETALGAIPNARQNEATGALLREMARIGKSLDELARLAHAGPHAALAERLTAALDGHWARVRQLAQDGRRSAGTAPQVIPNRFTTLTPITAPAVGLPREERRDRRDEPRQAAEPAGAAPLAESEP